MVHRNDTQWDPVSLFSGEHPDPPVEGLLVTGHGTANARGAAETEAVARLVAEALPRLAVELAYLEVITPSIADGLERLRERGCRRVVVAPLLLFEAGHARRDLPAAVAEAAERLGMQTCQAAPLGDHPAILELARRRRHEAIAAAGWTEEGALVPATVLFVGRGSSEPDAAARVAGFARASVGCPRSAEHVGATAGGGLCQTTCMGPCEPPCEGPVITAFVAAARPSLEEGIAAAMAAGRRRVIVQPHLLFRGRVEDQVARSVAAAREADRQIAWAVAARLGPDAAVARGLITRAAEAVAAANPAIW